MVVEDLISKTVFLDTAPLIYYIEGFKPYEKKLDKLFDLNRQGLITFVTTTITLVEILVKPLREKKFELARQYKDLLVNSEDILIVDINIPIASQAADLRAEFGFKTPDSIQLATASLLCDFFLTNDKRLKLEGNQEIIILDDLN